MNVIEQFKKGYKIKIKESQKGSFTKYCNGKVTNECIQRGKNSPDPKIRKKATFAQNARRWKHQLGGQLIKAQEGTKFLSKQWFQNASKNVNNFLSSDFGKFAINGVNDIVNQVKSANFSKDFDKATNVGKKFIESKNWMKSFKEGLVKGQQYFQMQQLQNPGINFGQIDIQNFAKNYANSADNSEEINEYENNRFIEKQNYLQSMQQSSGGGFGSLLTEGLGLAGQFLSSKKSNNTGTTNQSTSLNGSPNTYNVFQNNTYTLPSLKTPVLTAPTIPTKYMTV